MLYCIYYYYYIHIHILLYYIIIYYYIIHTHILIYIILSYTILFLYLSPVPSQYSVLHQSLPFLSQYSSTNLLLSPSSVSQHSFPLICLHLSLLTYSSNQQFIPLFFFSPVPPPIVYLLLFPSSQFPSHAPNHSIRVGS